jgi:uncharacterized protein
MEATVVDNPAEQRFELAVGDAIAAAYYQRDGDRIVLVHTEVPEELSGRGIGSKLAAGVFALIRKDGRKTVALCPFMAAWAKRHPQAADMADG